MDGKHGRTTSGVECHHRLWAAHTVEQRRAWHAIIALGSTHGRTKSGVACHHRVEAAHTVERHRAWHAIIAFGQHTRLNDVGCGMTSPPLDNTYGRMTSDVKCHNRLWTTHSVERRRVWHAIIAVGQQTRTNDVWRGIPSSPLGSTNGQTTSGVA